MDPITALERIRTANLGPWDNAAWARARLEAHVDALPDLIDAYEGLLTEGMRPANQFLRYVHNALSIPGINLSASDEALCRWARARADQSQRLVNQGGPAGIRRALELPGSCRLTLPSLPSSLPPEVALAGTLARLSDERWWRRRIRRLAWQTRDQIQRWGQHVHREAQPYCANCTLDDRRAQNRRNIAMLESILAEDVDTGESITLAEASASSMANPELRRKELMARLSGFETIGEHRLDEALFITATAPNRFHPRSGKGPNRKYDGSTPRAAQRWLCQTWARSRAEIKRAGMRPYGFRIAEPHHDGTPHWHMLLWVPRGQRRALERILRKAWARDPEPGSDRHRLKIEPIDRNKGSAVGYVAKYVAKNIDGHEVGTNDQSQMAADEAAERIVACVATWGLRQFQQIGGPKVTVWRELRRLKEAENWWPPLVREAWAAADAGDWARYCEVAGGMRTWSGHPCDATTGQPRRPTHHPWGEPVAEAILGVQWGDVYILTRLRTWRIVAGRVSGPPLDLCE